MPATLRDELARAEAMCDRFARDFETFLMDRLEDAIAFLDRDVARRRKKLLATIDWSPDTEAPTKGQHEMVVR